MGVQINGSEGNVIATKGTFSGDVGIGGTLTYEDVTNIDSVGLVTARTGIEIGARPGVAASISVDGNMIVSGISTFGGDVQVSDKIIHSGDTNTAIRFPDADTITAETGGSESFRVDSSQRLLLGHTSSQTIGSNSHGLSQINVTANQPVLTLSRFENVSAGPSLILGKSRAGSAGSYTVVQDDDGLGSISFAGADGTDLVTVGASIEAQVDGTPGSNDMPTRLVFATTADGASSPTERLRIASDGKVGISTATPNAKLHVLAVNEAGILIEDNSSGNNAPYLEIIGKRTDSNVHQSFSGQVFLARNRTEQKISSGLKLGTILFGGNHTNASKSNILYAASIAGMSSDDFDSASDMPTDLVFFTGSTGRAPAASNVSSGTERVRITSAGYLQQHKLIAVSYSDSRELALSNADLTTSNFYNTTNFASDNSILDSNGHFVAPVHGIYRLYFRFTTDGDAGNRANVRLRKNGTTVNEAYANSNSSSNMMSVSSEIIMELNANEYLDIQVAQLHSMEGAQHKVVNFHMLG